MKNLSLLGLMMFTATMTLWACGGAEETGGGGSKCVPGEQIVCACPGTEVTGAQVCNGLGTGYEACQGCSGGSTNGAGGASAATSGNGGATNSTAVGVGGAAVTAAGSTVASGPATTATTTATTSTSSGGSGCNQGDCDACAKSTCAEQVCATELSTCTANPDCVKIITCIDNCPKDDFECYMNCTTANPNGEIDHGNLAFCQNCTACAMDCAMVCP